VGRKLAVCLGITALAACGGESSSHRGGGAAGQQATESTGGAETTSAGRGGAGTTSAGGASTTNAGGVSGVGGATAGRGGAGVTSPAAAGAAAMGDLGGSAGAGASVELIDDADHTDVPGSAFIWAKGIGNWFVSAPLPDGYTRDAAVADIVPPRGESLEAYRVEDSDRARGVDLWAQLAHPAGKAVDVQEYAGITFWAKLAGGGGRLTVGVNPGVSYFEAPSEVPSLELTLSADWQQFSLPFTAFGVDAQTVASFDFIVGEGGDAFDFWLDDLAFLCYAECPQ
jgi:hypothetical protein